jgi:hypothetical protein
VHDLVADLALVAEPLFNDLDALHGAPSAVTVDEPWPGAPLRRLHGRTGVCNRCVVAVMLASRILGEAVATWATVTRGGRREYDHHPIPTGDRGDRAAQVV